MAATLFLAVATIGCTSSLPEADAATDACETPGYSAEKISLGYVHPDQGALGTVFRAARSGVEARIQEANEAGGVHGRTIDYTWRDDRGDPDGNLRAVTELVEIDRVFGVLEATTAASGGAEYLAENHIPVAGIAAEEEWSLHRNMFAPWYSISDGPSVNTFGLYVQARGGTRVAVVRSDLDSTTTISAKIEASLAAVGIELAASEFLFNPASTSTPQLAQEIAASGADAVVGDLSAGQWAELLPLLAARGAQIKVILMPGGYNEESLRTYGANLSGLSTFVSFVPFEIRNQGHERYLTAMARFAPETSDPTTQLALNAYLSTDMYVRGLVEAGPCPTRESFVEALRAVDDYDGGGLLPGPVDLSENWGQISPCFTFLQVNADATGFDVVPNPTGSTESQFRWCGERLS